MSDKEYLTKEEVDILLAKAKTGNNDAWESLYKNFEKYIHSRINTLIVDFNDTSKGEMKKDLFQAGWIGFINAMKKYKVGDSRFLTYATHYIDGEMKRELSFLLNSLGIKDKPNNHSIKAESINAAEESSDERLSLEIKRALTSVDQGIVVDADVTEEKYPAEGRVVQILEILRFITDENHTLSKEEIKRYLRLYRAAKYGKLYKLDADNTITSTIEQLIEELNPLEYTKENADDFKILYEGYQENRYQENRNGNNKKSQPLTGFSYNHIFSYKELDELIAQICFSDIISSEDKNKIVKQLISTTSVYYKSQFWDGEKIIFNPKAVHNRFDSKKGQERSYLINNISVLQEALNNLAQVRFKFNRYNEEGELVATSDYIHCLSPYHLVMYKDNYYCIGLKKEDKRIWHYRIDLMSDVEIVRDDNGDMVHIEVSDFDGLPISNVNWDPEKYMSEHLNMAYDEPQSIHVKIKNTDYTILHDWFGNHYEKTDFQAEEGYDIVKVKASPSMIVHWAVQYSDKVEIMDENIRQEIRKELKKLNEQYKIYS